MKFLIQIFTWWNNQSFGTQIFTWRKGQFVGEDNEGNKYYRNSDDTKRWIIYNGLIEASRVSPDWHGWLHHTFDENPAENALAHKVWEKPHVENLTASENAYRPKGSIFAAKQQTAQDYEAWQPE
ncbi:MAG: NADH:ubiquinone oxidoreductase subunit NDUFA12 [Paracoccaceae bacterium]